MCRASITESKARLREQAHQAVQKFLAEGKRPTECPPCAFARPADRLSDREESRRQKAQKLASEQALRNRVAG